MNELIFRLNTAAMASLNSGDADLMTRAANAIEQLTMMHKQAVDEAVQQYLWRLEDSEAGGCEVADGAGMLRARLNEGASLVDEPEIEAEPAKRSNSIPPETLAFAYELRQEYGLSWKSIARQTGYDAEVISGAVYRALKRGIPNG